MQGKPAQAAGGAAKGNPPVVGIGDFHVGSAVSAVKGVAYGLGFYFFRVFPVQPLAMSRAEFRPPVRRLGHPHQLAAFQAVKGPQGFLTTGRDRLRRAGGRSAGSNCCSISA